MFTRSRFGEHYLPDVQGTAFVDEASSAVFARSLQHDFAADDTFFVVVGADSGLLAGWLTTQVTGDGSRAVVVESDALLPQIRERLGSALEGSKVQLCKACEAGELLNEQTLQPWLLAGKVVLVDSIAARAGRHPEYKALQQNLRLELSASTHRVGLASNSRAFIDVQIQNLADNRVPADCLGTFGQGCTAIVVGGGPSMDDHLDWIQANRERLFLIAASRVVGRLLDVGLVPDAIVGIDPQGLLYDISRPGLTLADTPLVSSYHVSSQLLQQWRGPTLYMGQALPWRCDDQPDARNIGSSGPTVTHSALWLAHEWGFSQILLSGVDLCYGAGGNTHASGSLEASGNSLPVDYHAHVVTYSGRQAGTSTALKLGCEVLEDLGRTIATAGGRVCNLACEAARVSSIEQRDPADVTLGAPRPALHLDDEPSGIDKHYALRRRQVRDAMQGLRELRKACKRAQGLLDGLHGRGGKRPDYRCKPRLDALERTLERRQTRWLAMVKSYGSFEFLRTLAPRGFDSQSDEELEAWGRNYYRILDRSAKRMLLQFERTATRLDWRIEERRPAPDIAPLLDYWRVDRTLGRMAIRFDGAARTADSLSADDAELLESARREFAEELMDADSSYARKLARTESDAGNVVRTIAILFDAEHRDELARLIAALQASDSTHVQLIDWAEGQLAELQGRSDDALDAYQSVLEAHATLADAGTAPPEGTERLLENTLLRIVPLQLAADAPEQALEGLQLLTQISPVHAAREARMLELLNRPQEAIALLQRSLEAGHGDRRTALQLADLFESIGASDAADVARALSAELGAGKHVPTEQSRAA